MPPNTVKVRNGSPATASTTASQTQMLVATTSPSLAPSRRESCLPDRVTVAATMSFPRPGRMHSALAEDPRDAREGLTGRLGDVAPAVCSRPAHPVVERLGARPARLPHNDPAYHPDRFVGHTVIVIDPGYGERDVEMIARVHEEPRVPCHGALRNSQRMMIVLRVVGGRRVHVLPHDPAHRRPRLYVDPNRVEPYPGADGVTAHLNHLEDGRRTEPHSEEPGYGRAPVWHEPK